MNEYDSGSCKYTTPAQNMEREHLRVIKLQDSNY